MNELFNFPKQRLPYSEKVAKNKKWCRNMIDNLLLNYAHTEGGVNDYQSDYNRKLSNYQLYNNILNQKDFERECNPLGIEVGQFKDEIQPYNKTYNKIQVLLGEEIKRPFNYRTVLVNSDGIRSKLQVKEKLLREFIMAQVRPLLGQDPSEEEKQNVIPPEKLDEYMNKTYLDAREHTANQILQYLLRKESLAEKKNDGFKHGLLAGEEFVWVGIRNGEPVIDVLNPLGVFYHKSPEVKYIEDGLYAGYRTMMTTGDIIDKFGDYLEEADLEKLEHDLNGVTGMDEDIVGKQMKYQHNSVTDAYMTNFLSRSQEEGSYSKAKGEDWLVTHVEWKSQKKVGFITFTNDFGDEETDIVDENFVMPTYAIKTKDKDKYGKNITKYEFDGYTLEWSWIPEIWQGIRIGDNIYCCMSPKEYQHRSMDNPKSVRLGYHGIVYNAMNAESKALMDRMKPFQYIYFILVHKLKKLIARDRGKVFHFDTTMVPEQIGLEKAIYYLEEMDIDFYNPLLNAEKPGVHQRAKVTTSTDRSNMQHIMHYISLMDAIDMQISDVAGINRVREGQVSNNEAVTNAQQNLIQSSTITEAVYFFPHEKLWENVLNSLVQSAQACWKNKSIIKQFVLDDLSISTLKVTPSTFENADFGVFISNIASDNELFANVKQLAQPLIQNDKAKFTDIISMFKASSVGELEAKIQQSEKQLQQEQLEQIRAQQEAQQAAQQMAMQEQAAQREHELQLQMQKDEAALARELIKLSAQNGENSVDPATIHKMSIDQQKLELEKQKLKVDDKNKDADRKSREKISKMKSASKPSSTP